MPDDPFALLGLEPRVAIDADELHRRCIEASAENHPDRFTDPIEQADAADRAAEINAAYRKLQDPERRANALLVLRGGPTKEQDKSLPDDLLMEMMEVRERMEDAVTRDDADELATLQRWADDQRRSRLDNVAALFDADDLTAVREQLNALRYIERMLEQMPEPNP